MSGAQYTRTYTYDNLNRLLTVNSSHYTYADNAHLHAATNTSAYASYSYDASGDMTCRAPNSATGCGGSSPTGAPMGYDIQGQLASWQNAPSSPTTTAKYLYDGEGQRVEQQVTSGGTTTTTLYLSNLEEVAITGSTTTNTADYYANGQRIALSVNGAISYLGSDGLGSDGLGSATTTLDSSGNAQASELYMPYGGGRWSSGTMPTRRLYTGQVSDAAASGLDYYNARSYDPTLGQFVSADTEPSQLNRYAYVSDNPSTKLDLDGHCWPWCAPLIGAAAGALIGGGISVVSQVSSGKSVDWSQVGQSAVQGAVVGAVIGTAVGFGPVASEALASGLSSGLAAMGATTVVADTSATIGASAIMGAGEGFVQGALSGDSGWNLVADVGIGAVSGGVGGAAGIWASKLAMAGRAADDTVAAARAMRWGGLASGFGSNLTSQVAANVRGQQSGIDVLSLGLSTGLGYGWGRAVSSDRPSLRWARNHPYLSAGGAAALDITGQWGLEKGLRPFAGHLFWIGY